MKIGDEIDVPEKYAKISDKKHRIIAINEARGVFASVGTLMGKADMHTFLVHPDSMPKYLRHALKMEAYRRINSGEMDNYFNPIEERLKRAMAKIKENPTVVIDNSLYRKMRCKRKG